jgi:transcriptional regulator GlxA family with amidase domain
MTTQQEKTTIRYGFLLVNKYSMIALTSAIEPLRMANRLSGKTLYVWQTFTLDGSPACASNGLILEPEGALETAKDFDVIFVCAGVDVSDVYTKHLHHSLVKMAHDRIKLGSLCTGSYLLARSGLLDGYKCTIHWEHIASMREEFSHVTVSDELFELDRDRYTCAGGNASLDMMLTLISDSHGGTLSANISEQFMCDRIRSQSDRQRAPLQQHLGASQPKLIEAITLMEANIEEPISIDELSKLVGVSRRQLERLFQKYVNCVPTRYYMDLRLNCSRRLLLQTGKSIIDISLACGFVSPPHFSKCYRDFFGLPPRDERMQKLSNIDSHS